jgi:hypothetical protein
MIRIDEAIHRVDGLIRRGVRVRAGVEIAELIRPIEAPILEDSSRARVSVAGGFCGGERYIVGIALPFGSWTRE